MTMTRSEKRKRRGRPRSDGPRTESGQLSRASGPPADETARQARQRIFGISYEDTKNPDSATFVGRLAMLGTERGISREQYEAIERFLATRAQYRRGIQVPDSLANFTSGPTPIYDEEEAGKRFSKVKERHLGAVELITRLGNETRSPLIRLAFENCIIRDIEMSYLIGEIRMIGNSLMRFYRD